jgi:hypothetical protein
LKNWVILSVIALVFSGAGCSIIDSNPSGIDSPPSVTTEEIGPESGMIPGPETCAKSPSNYTCSDSDDMLIYPELIAAIEKAQNIIPFPDGAWVDLPVDNGWYVVDPATGALGRDHWFPDEGITSTEGNAYCLWAKVWLAEQGTGSENEKDAWSYLSAFPQSLVFSVYYDEGSREYTRSVITAASLGDSSKLANDFAINCESPYLHWAD